MKPQSQQKSQQANVTWEDVLKYPTHRKIAALKKSYPKKAQYLAGRVIENSGFESHDLLFWQIAFDAYKARLLTTTCGNTTELKAQLEKQSSSMELLGKRISELKDSADTAALLHKEVEEIKRKLEESASSRQVETLQTTFDSILTNRKKPKATPKKLTKKEIWKEWIQTPQGITSSVIAVLMLLNLIF